MPQLSLGNKIQMNIALGHMGHETHGYHYWQYILRICSEAARDTPQFNVVGMVGTIGERGTAEKGAADTGANRVGSPMRS
jgi:hypothetical protein